MPAANQLATWADMTTAGVTYKNGGPPAGGAMIDANGFNTYITNDGGYPWGYASNQCMRFDAMQAHKTVGSSHSTTIASTTSTVRAYSHTVGGSTIYALYGEATGHTFTCNASTVAPSTATPITLNLTSITGLPYTGTSNDGVTQGNAGLTITLKDPGGTVRYTTTVTTGSSFTTSFTSSGFAAGAWVWTVIGTWDIQDGTSALGIANNIVYSGSFSSYY